MTGRFVLHLDLDAFFAAVEVLDDPSLARKPVIVGGMSNRGVVATCSYEARPFGVHSAMPMVEARRLCPQAIVVPPRHERYAELSEQVFAIFGRYTPLVEGLSLDEAFLDVTQSQALFGDAVHIARRIKQEVRAETGLTVSAGVAPCKFVAKIASDLQKPDGLVVVRPEDVARFLAPLPIERMWGVGPVAAERLHQAGFLAIGDLAATDPARLEAHLGSWGRTVHALARGIDDREVEPHLPAKSVGAEETFDTDLTHPDDMLRELLAQSERVARRLQSEGHAGHTVVVKIKYADFTLKTRRQKLAQPVSDLDSIFATAKELLGHFELRGKRVRLTGVAVTDLATAGPAQRSLFPDPVAERRARLQKAAADIEAKFGEQGVTRATLLARRRS
ncbi:MAG: DNA polymerase IV [Deltaproteobacteria bacterium]|nr:DNA polymerase IV [Deltaproteobacteria bacterium]